MKSKLKGVLFFGVAGAVLGLLWASGILGFFRTRDYDLDHGPHWKLLTKEEYRANQRRYPLYGAAAGLAIGAYLFLRPGPTK